MACPTTCLSTCSTSCLTTCPTTCPTGSRWREKLHVTGLVKGAGGADYFSTEGSGEVRPVPKDRRLLRFFSSPFESTAEPTRPRHRAPPEGPVQGGARCRGRLPGARGGGRRVAPEPNARPGHSAGPARITALVRARHTRALEPPGTPGRGGEEELPHGPVTTTVTALGRADPCRHAHESTARPPRATQARVGHRPPSPGIPSRSPPEARPGADRHCPAGQGPDRSLRVSSGPLDGPWPPSPGRS